MTTGEIIDDLRIAGLTDAADRMAVLSLLAFKAGNLAQAALGVAGGRDLCTGKIYGAATLASASEAIAALRAALEEYDEHVLATQARIRANV